MPRLLLATLLLISAVSPAVAADQSSIAEHWLKSQLKGKPKILRNFPCDTVLYYNHSGKPTERLTPGPWTLCGEVKFDQVKVVDGKLRLKGARQLVVFSGKFGESEKLRDSDRALVVIADLPSLDVPQLQRTLDSIFLRPSDLAANAPPLWRSYLMTDEAVRDFRKDVDNKGDPDRTVHRDALNDAALTPVRVPAEVAYGLSIHRETPRYPAEARNAQAEGSAVLESTVDGNGKLTDLRIVKPIGAGLDEAAADAVAKWTYHPLLVNGVPRKFITYVRVHFALDKRPAAAAAALSGRSNQHSTSDADSVTVAGPF